MKKLVLLCLLSCPASAQTPAPEPSLPEVIDAYCKMASYGFRAQSENCPAAMKALIDKAIADAIAKAVDKSKENKQ